jgi:hypothetical protein
LEGEDPTMTLEHLWLRKEKRRRGIVVLVVEEGKD